ncbi:MAG: hypothetical protein FJZ13_04795 [Candidatus Omnitrophica bacterium]|nr:hypothetical protein [Candidatus Omnitrophota bacterium]
MNVNRRNKYITIAVVLLIGLAFVAKFSGPSVLRLYVESGIGNCRTIPILCMAPTEEITKPQVNQGYIQGLLPYRSPKMNIDIPRDFSVYEELLKKVYYKKIKRPHREPVIYLVHKTPNFFIDLFPNVKKQGILDNYAFLRRVMYAQLKDIEDLTDAFFIIMKGIFIPDLGDQKNVIMAQFSLGNKRGFINYNLGSQDNYFDCNVLDRQDNFFKVYIKDRGATLDLDKVLAIISTVDSAKGQYRR